MLCSLPTTITPVKKITPVIPKPKSITPPTKKVIKKETPKPIIKKPKEIKKIIKKKKRIISKKVEEVIKTPPIIEEVITPEPIKEKVIEKKELPKDIPTIGETLPKIEEVIEEAPHVKQEVLVEQKETSLEEEYLNKHIQKITELLSENLYYPRSARKRNIQGEVMVKFKLSTSANAYDIEVVSSKSDILSRAAIKTIEDLSGEFPIPPEELHLHVPITYSLNQ